EPNDPEKRFTGRVVVLIGPANMSSCESFILMMKQSPDCTLVGERTWGSSGNPKPHKLCNAVTVYVPSWQDMLPDGTLLEGRGLEPDVKVPTTPRDFESDDPVLKRAL
ncbi:MAG TPA: S41 family peptidase, partial [Phycisphaerae bacterium]